MPAELGPATEVRHPARAAISPVFELSFALFATKRLRAHEGRPEPEWLAVIQVDRPDLFERVATFWDDLEPYPEWGEVLIVASDAGVVLDESIDRFLGILDLELQRPHPVPRLPSEPDEVQGIIERRLRRLRESEALRREYVGLIRQFWAFLTPYWEDAAKPFARAFARDLQAQLDAGADIRDLVPPSHFCQREMFAALVDDALRSARFVIVPMGLAGEGKSFFSLPGMLLAGFGPGAEAGDERRRELAERASARFKVLSDPTRVTILASLMHRPQSVTDLATRFRLSQPTVSVHIKALREAGLLEGTRSGSSTHYQATRDRVERLLAEAQEGLFSR